MLMGLASLGGYSNAPTSGRFCWGAMFGPKTHCVVVVGAQWGDEGKGKIVDVLAERADLVVRYQGGANAGHTVHTAAGEFVLHQIPSGIIQGAICVVGNGVVLDPETLFTELDALSERGVRTQHKLYVSERAHLTLPFHKLLDRAREAKEKIGTTGRGIGPTYEDKYGRRGIRVGDLRNPARARELVCARVQAANQFLEVLASPERADAAEHVQLLERLAPRLLPLAIDGGRRGRSRDRPYRHRRGAGRGEGVHDPRGQRTPAYRGASTPRREDPGAGRRVRRHDGTPTPLRLVRRGSGALRRAGERAHRTRGHQAGRAGLVRRNPGVRRLPPRRGSARFDARRSGAARTGGAGVRVATRLAALLEPGAPAGGPAAGRAGLPGSPAGPGPCPDSVCQRRYAPRPDHRSDVTLSG